MEGNKIDNGMIRFIVVSLVALVTFGSLTALIGSDLLINVKVYANPAKEIGDWYGFDFTGYNFTGSWNHTIREVIENHWFSIGGRNLVFYENYNYLGDNSIGLSHKYGWYPTYEGMNWFNSKGLEVSHSGSSGFPELYQSQMNIDYSNATEEYNSESGLIYKVVCKGEGFSTFGSSAYFFVYAFIGFNKTAYSLPSEAFEHDDLHIYIGINPEQSYLQKDIFYIMSSLMFFNTYVVFGSTDSVSVMLNYVIGIFAWSMAIIPIALLAKELISDWI